MKVACEQCAVVHDIEPPPWIIASGKAFPMTCPACGHRQNVQPSVGIELEARGESYGELDSGTAVREDPQGRQPAAGRTPTGGYRPAGAYRPTTGRDEVEDELADSDPIISYRKARDMLDVTVADTPAWRGRHDATDAGETNTKSSTLQLRQGDDIFEVPDLATLQRWIMERRVEPDDELPDGSGGWLRAGDRPDLAVFFLAMEQLDSYDGPAAPPQHRRPKPPPPERPRRTYDTEDEGDDHTAEAVAPPTEEHPYPTSVPPLPPPALEFNTRPMRGYEDDSPTELLNTSVDGILPSAPAAPPERLIVDTPAAAGKDVTSALRGVVRAPQHAPVVPDPTATSAVQLVGAFFVFVAITLAGLWWYQHEATSSPVQVILQPGPAPAALPAAAPAPAATAPQDAPAGEVPGASPAPATAGPAEAPRATEPKAVTDLLDQAAAATQQGKFEDAANAAERALALNPTSARGHLDLGAALVSLQRTAEGVFHLCTARGKLTPADDTKIRQILSGQGATCPSVR